MAEFRAGFVALLGPPNAGKSSLLNALLGERLAIVSPRPQTTRSRILGVLPRADAQILFLDTPGRHRGERAFNTALNAIVEEALRDCDLALVMVDAARGWEAVHDEIAGALVARAAPARVVVTKIDLLEGGARGRAGARQRPPSPADRLDLVLRDQALDRARVPDAWREGAYAVSARTGQHLEALVDGIIASLPVSPALYAEDTLTDRNLRWLAGERVREAAIGLLAEELPHALAVEVVTFDESDPRLVRIRAELLVERESQKRIVIGQGGSQIKAIGIRAREAIEPLVGRRVHLELFVKVERDWSRSPRRLAELGYR